MYVMLRIFYTWTNGIGGDMRTQFLILYNLDQKKQLLEQLLKEMANDRKMPGIVREVKMFDNKK